MRKSNIKSKQAIEEGDNENCCDDRGGEQERKDEFFDELDGFESDSNLEKEINLKNSNLNNGKKKRKQKLKKKNSINDREKDFTFSDHVIFDSFSQPPFSPIFPRIPAFPKVI